MAPKPYSETRLAKFVSERIEFLRSKKTQSEIAAEVGFDKSPNMISNIKSGASRLPLGRVPALARALECDPGELMLMALQQNHGHDYRLIEEIMQTAITTNEAAWLDALRALSDGADPDLTEDRLSGLRKLLRGQQSEG